MRIGRDPDCDIFIDDKVVSLDHALIESVDKKSKKKETEYYLEDLDSTNHTYLNGKKIKRKKLKNNDLIRIGWSTFRFIDDNGSEKDKTLKIKKSWIPGVYYTKE